MISLSTSFSLFTLIPADDMVHPYRYRSYLQPVDYPSFQSKVIFYEYWNNRNWWINPI